MKDLGVALDRELPQTPDAERAVLGAILINNRAWFRVQPILAVGDFFKDAHRVIFAAMKAMAEEGEEIDTLALKERIGNQRQLDQAGGVAYISALIDVVPDVANVERYAALVAKKARLRRLIEAGNSLMRRALDGEDEPEVIAADALAALTPAATTADSQARPLAEVIWEAYTAAEKLSLEGRTTALRCDWPELNAYDVLQPTLIALGAPSNHGKTAFMMSLAGGLARNGSRVAIFSLESAPRDLAWRHVSATSQVPHSRVRDWRRLASGDIGKLTDAHAEARRLPIYLTRSIRTIDAIYSEARRIKAINGLEAIAIDYVQLIGYPNGPRDREERMAAISQRLLELAIDQQILVLMLSQLTEERKERKSGRLHQSDLKYARAIGESSRVVLMFQRPHADDKADHDLNPHQVLFQCEKNNEGRTGDYEMHFDERTQRFTDGTCADNGCRGERHSERQLNLGESEYTNA